jgi:hypothetical protein
MTEPTTYEIVIRGRASARLLRPLLDDFTIDHAGDGVTRLIGDIGDASHLHGVLVHLTSVCAEVISIAPLRPEPPTDPADQIGPAGPVDLADPADPTNQPIHEPARSATP